MISQERLLTRTLLSLLVAFTLLCTGIGSATAVTYYFALDVPSTLGPATFTPNVVVRSDNALYQSELTLPSGVELGALNRKPDGTWLFASALPTTLGPLMVEPRDIVGFDGASFSLVLDGASAGIPAYARIDSLLLDAGSMVLSFDVPTRLSGTEYSRADLVRFDGGTSFSLWWDAESRGVPPYANVVGAAVDGAAYLVLTFDVPTHIGGQEFLPGQLVVWNGATFADYFRDPAWPASSQLRDFAFAPPAGAVPDGTLAGLDPLTVATAPGGQITLSWGASCASGDDDYEVYEGVIGSYYSHAPKSCSTNGLMTMTFTPAGASSYYLVTPRNALREGSYGLRSNGMQRPQGPGACLVQEVAQVCQ